MEGMTQYIGRYCRRVSVLLALTALLIGGCPAAGGGGGGGGGDGGGGNIGGGGDDGNDNGGGGDGGGDNMDGLRATRTNALLEPTGDLKAGTDIIVVGTGVQSGVQYLIPSRGDMDALSLSNFDTFVTAGFGVAGNRVMVRTLDGNVGLFDGATETLTMFDETELALFSGAAAPGVPEFWGDGNSFITIADPNRVADARSIKMIEFVNGAPVITSFLEPTVEPVFGREGERWQVAVDATARQFVVQVTDFLLLYNMDDPAGEPGVFELSGTGGVTNTQSMHLDDGNLIYQTNERSGNGRDMTRIANFGAGNTILLSENPSQSRPMDLESGIFGYFAFVTDADNNTNATARSIFGTIGANGPEITTFHAERTAIGDDPDDGIIGFGCSLAITPDGRFRFIAGCGTVAVAEYLQVSDGGEFTVFPDQFDLDFAGLGMPASRVDASNTLAVFQTADDSVAYIELN